MRWEKVVSLTTYPASLCPAAVDNGKISAQVLLALVVASVTKRGHTQRWVFCNWIPESDTCVIPGGLHKPLIALHCITASSLVTGYLIRRLLQAGFSCSLLAAPIEIMSNLFPVRLGPVA